MRGLCWIPRRQAQHRRADDSPHDPNSVPVLAYPHEAGSNTLLLYCHGNSEDLGNLQYICGRIRSTLRIHVMGIEYPGYGISQGEASETGVSNDVLIVYTFCRFVLGFPAENIILLGFSIGTGPTTTLASRERVGGLVLIAPYTSIRDMVKEILPSGVGKVAQYFIANRFNNAEAIKTAKCPTLIIHGRSDKLIPYAHSETLYQNSGSSRKELYLSEEMDHCFTDMDFDAYILFPVMEFLQRELRGPIRHLKLPAYVFQGPENPAGDPIDPDNPVPVVLADPSEIPQEELEHQTDSLSHHAPGHEDMEDWECTRCTFVNCGDVQWCEMCAASRATHSAPVPQPQAAPGRGGGGAGRRNRNRDGDDDDDDDDDDHDGSALRDDDVGLEDIASFWSCSMCTFLNPPADEKCGICEAARPAGASKAAAGSAGGAGGGGSTSGGDDDDYVGLKRYGIRRGSNSSSNDSNEDEVWSCPACTLENSALMSRCSVCGCARKVEISSETEAALDGLHEQVQVQAGRHPEVEVIAAGGGGDGSGVDLSEALRLQDEEQVREVQEIQLKAVGAVAGGDGGGDGDGDRDGGSGGGMGGDNDDEAQDAIDFVVIKAPEPSEQEQEDEPVMVDFAQVPSMWNSSKRSAMDHRVLQMNLPESEQRVVMPAQPEEQEEDNDKS